jgi:aspartyl-tRNA(Asn)/glutamyl-tRNA(Gln) amidotransferase subunit C
LVGTLLFPCKYRRLRERYVKGGIILDPLRITAFSAVQIFAFTSVSPRLFFAMALTSQDIGRIAHLARLELHRAESERMLAQINGFFDIVEKMRAVDTRGVEPLSHPVAAFQDVTLRLREDRIGEPNQREANQRSAPLVERGLFLVPKVIE